MIEISKAFEGGAEFTQFDRVRMPKDLKFVGLMQYDGDLKLPTNYLVPPSLEQNAPLKLRDGRV